MKRILSLLVLCACSEGGAPHTADLPRGQDDTDSSLTFDDLLGKETAAGDTDTDADTEEPPAPTDTDSYPWYQSDTDVDADTEPDTGAHDPGTDPVDTFTGYPIGVDGDTDTDAGPDAVLSGRLEIVDIEYYESILRAIGWNDDKIQRYFGDFGLCYFDNDLKTFCCSGPMYGDDFNRCIPILQTMTLGSCVPDEYELYCAEDTPFDEAPYHMSTDYCSEDNSNDSYANGANRNNLYLDAPIYAVGHIDPRSQAGGSTCDPLIKGNSVYDLLGFVLDIEPPQIGSIYPCNTCTRRYNEETQQYEYTQAVDQKSSGVDIYYVGDRIPNEIFARLN